MSSSLFVSFGCIAGLPKSIIGLPSLRHTSPERLNVGYATKTAYALALKASHV